MKRSIVILFLLFSTVLYAAGDKRAVDYVNPLIGTGAIDNMALLGNTYPGATAPFGLVQLSPDTRDKPDWDCASGYNYNDKVIYGFSHTHLNGTGAAELFDLLFMPVTEEANITRESLGSSDKGWESEFSHSGERAAAGYYSVLLGRYNIESEFTATKRCGVHRYSYPEGRQKKVVIDFDHSRHKGSWGTRVLNAQIRQIDSHTVAGYRVITGWAKLRKVYFYVRFSEPIVGNLMSSDNRVYSDSKVANGERVKAVFDFGGVSDVVVAKVGLSATGIEGAKMNMEAECGNHSFDQIVENTQNDWQTELSKIEIEGTEEQKAIFYTALYHASIQPNIISDVDGAYIDADYTKKKLNKGEEHYTTFSLWDTFRAAHPLYTILQPERTTHFVNSMLRHYNSYGYLPIWQLWGQDNYCMIGNHAIPVIVDAILKGAEGIDIEKAYEAVKNSSTTPHLNSPFDVWEEYGYMPEDIQTQSVSITLELAFDDWCVAQLAKKLGKEKDYAHFMERSEYYQNLFHPETKFFQSKNSKREWIEPFDALKYGANGGYPFTEGNAWQYFWFVPHQVEKLVELVGGKDEFERKLDTFFTLEERSGEFNDNISGLIGQYAHGNEPSHHVIYLYNYTNSPWKTQKYAQKVMTELYSNDSAGYPGNEDCGQMSAWYIFSSLGFYPVNPASGVYEIGSPVADGATIDLGNGVEFRVEVERKSAKDIYVQSVKLNSKKHNKPYISHSDIVEGGELVFVMGSKPSKWGSKR